MIRGKIKWSAFIKSTTRKGIYDRMSTEESFPFSFLKIEKAKADYLKNFGVHYVVQSWKIAGGNREKVLHTGLIYVENGIYYGNNINRKGKLDFLLLIHNNAKKQIHMFILQNKNPKRKFEFAEILVKEIAQRGYCL